MQQPTISAMFRSKSSVEKPADSEEDEEEIHVPFNKRKRAESAEARAEELNDGSSAHLSRPSLTS